MNNQDLNKEKALLQQLATGDEYAFRSICETYTPLLYTTIFRFTSEKWIAEEIIQDTFLKVWTKRQELAEMANFKGWLYTVASNMTLNALKKMRREQQELDRWLTFNAADIAKNDLTPQEKESYLQLLAAAVERLPPRQRETYRLIKEQHLKRNEAARIMGVSPETVKWNLEEAVRNIRTYCLSKLPVVLTLLLID
ncbi:sigma-70 family RNA polymerase sigma factor [Chitinophaga horti]|uniref:Sigma-70 family RNA polymerase sigma factor n=1 Tax=Chitinophaga horti TaxID=2920382 RepID=A0ABY6IUB4_9BACT|nr:sigma-70 family RNA polymerase sigma factor [Chitinophaga horti]UYQ90965.1 sigma-70 family RNA polymerase sigma factor [Chitinophaga horti]